MGRLERPARGDGLSCDAVEAKLGRRHLPVVRAWTGSDGVLGDASFEDGLDEVVSGLRGLHESDDLEVVRQQDGQELVQ
jgi:hypothetical protein